MSPRQQSLAVIHIDEPHVRVTEYRFEPGAESYFVFPLLDGDRLKEPGGGSRIASLRRHASYARREGVEHKLVNANA